MFRPWQDSAHTNAQWLASRIIGSVRPVGCRSRGKLGLSISTEYYVNGVVTKRIARGLASRMKNTFSTSNAVAIRENVGSPMSFTWAAHPRDNEDCSASVGLELRVVPRQLGGTTWKLPPNVEVEVNAEEERTPRTLQQSQFLAFDLACEIRCAMTGNSLKETSASSGFNRLANTVSAGKHDKGSSFQPCRSTSTPGTSKSHGRRSAPEQVLSAMAAVSVWQRLLIRSSRHLPGTPSKVPWSR